MKNTLKILAIFLLNCVFGATGLLLIEDAGLDSISLGLVLGTWMVMTAGVIIWNNPLSDIWMRD